MELLLWKGETFTAPMEREKDRTGSGEKSCVDCTAALMENMVEAAILMNIFETKMKWSVCELKVEQ